MASPETITIGGDLQVRRLAYGAMRVTGPDVWGPPPDASQSRALLRRVVEAGVNLLDTADCYGPNVSENMIAEALYPYPEDLVIASKGGLTHPNPDEWVRSARPERLRRCCEDSLRRLKLEQIDIYHLHWVDPEVPIEDSVAALAELQQEGKIRHIGLCNVTVEGVERAQKIADIVSIQNHYNLVHRQSEDVLERCQQDGLAFLPYYPLMTGDLAEPGGILSEIAAAHDATPTQVALAWLLQHSAAAVPIPGTSSIKHFEENLQAAELELTDAEMRALDAAAPQMPAATGPGQPFPRRTLAK